MLTLISILLAGILILVVVLEFWSYPGKPQPFVDENGRPLPGSISEKVFAPVKGFYTFEKSAHSPIFEEPEKVQKILHEDVLPGTNHLADPQPKLTIQP